MKKGQSMRKRIFDIIQIGSKGDFPSVAFDMFIVTVIILNILVMFLETYAELAPLYHAFKIIEAVTVGVFCIEYALRIWTADFLYPDEKKGRARLKFLVSFDGIIDLLTILPFFFLSGFIVFRMLRVVRIFHLFRINAQYDSFHIITTVLKEKKNQIISSVFIIIILMLASSLGIYHAEHDAQPDVFRNAFSGIWWSMATLLTVGYGDIYPVTVIGRLMGICIAFLGVGVVAIPTGIISAGFVEQYTAKQHSDKKFRDIKNIGEILIDGASELLGLCVGDVQKNYSMRIMMVIRGELTVLPSENLALQENDIIIVDSERLVE
ncbi:MAG: ion transporter [Huintestinicola sp.]